MITALRFGWLVSLVGLVGLRGAAGAAVETAEVARRVREIPVTHPRLFLPAGGEPAIQQRVASDRVWQGLQAGLLAAKLDVDPPVADSASA